MSRTISSLLLTLLLVPAGLDAADRPNIVLIVSDDQGYGDVSCYDHPEEVKTPNLDRIAAAGSRFTNGYASAYVCARSRAGLMTGRYQQRFGFYSGADSRIGLPQSEVTIAEYLQPAGYATGVFGKWHLGLEKPYHPLSRGFDEFYGFLGHGAHDYFELRKDDDHNSIWRNWERIDDTGYLTDNLGREAASFIRRHKEEPFFLYLPFNAVHWPLQAPEEAVAEFDNENPGRNIYLGMLKRMDLAVGVVLDELKAHDLQQNTLLLFYSDNGGSKKVFANNGALRDYKQSTYEGGLRVPFMVSWPAVLDQGKLVNEAVISLDFFPTVCEAAGLPLPEGKSLDGKSLLPLLKGKQQERLHERLYWDGDEGRIGIRSGDWKLVGRGDQYQLFDLSKDPGEQKDLAGMYPEKLAEVRAEFKNWRDTLPRTLRQQKSGQP
ncbi:MAG: sulfatase [Fuerstiella sp.]|nr:sulfatase [Fuerstiella sp.]